MVTTIFVPPLKVLNRFTKYVSRLWCSELSKRLDNVICLDTTMMGEAKGDYFSDNYLSIIHDSILARRLIHKIRSANDKIAVLFYDLFYPGIMGGLLPTLRLVANEYNRELYIMGYLHGGVWNSSDVFKPLGIAKELFDYGVMMMADRIYVGSQYFKQKILYSVFSHTTSSVYKALREKIRVNPLAFAVRSLDKRFKDIDLFVPRHRYPIRSMAKRKLIGSWISKYIDHHNVEIAEEKLGDKFIEYLARSKVTLFCKEHETFGVAETEAIFNYSLPYCPIDCEAMRVTKEVHRELYMSIRKLLYDPIRNYSAIRREIEKYISQRKSQGMAKPIRRKYDIDKGYIYNYCFFDNITKEILAWGEN